MTDRIEADIAIIGAGIAGTGAAAALAGRHRLVLIEQETRPGYHSTGRSAAIYVQNYGNEAIRELTRASGDFFRVPPKGFAEAPLLTPRAILFIATAETRPDLDGLLAESIGLTEIDPDAAVRMAPILKREPIVAAAVEADAHNIDVDALHQGWLRKARAEGATFLPDAPVSSGRRDNGRWLLATPKGEVAARIVVNAAGAWSDKVAEACGLAPVGLQPLRRSMAVLPVPEGYDASGWPMVIDAAESWYMKPEAGRLFVSPADEDPVDPHDAFPDDMVLAEGLHRYEQAVIHPVTRVESSWAGLRTFAPDRTPVAGFDPSAEAFFWLAGQGGYGIQTSPALSRLAAALISGEWLPDSLEPLVAALSPARFRQG